ncbi:MAG: SAM-dependent chlorinase/fluorinase [Solirubrobacterales bacterium]|nr:SAM-dependent chlorinase/fluorinase [Solirubrobacterales bacterium]
MRSSVSPEPENTRPVSFLTDFGYSDEYPGVCRLVIAGIDPGIRVIDVTHGIPPGDIRRGALALAASVRYSPPAVHLAVVDPGVGSSRRAVVLTCGLHHFVGPDNGLLSLAATVLGGVEAAFDVSGTPVRAGDSDTFHGRDVFSPVAAELARGAAPGELGEAIGFRELVPLELPEPTITPEQVDANVLYPDQYGNVVLNLHEEVLDGTFFTEVDSVQLETSLQKTEVQIGRTFADVDPGEPVIYTDSTGYLALAVNRGSAASRFGLGPDNQLRFTQVASGR